MKTTVSSQEAKDARDKYAAAIRQKAKTVKEATGLEERLAKLKKQSEEKRGAFRDAKEDLAAADKKIVAVCEPAK